jgi:hypothetical protein
MPGNLHVRFGEGDEETCPGNGVKRFIPTLHFCGNASTSAGAEDGKSQAWVVLEIAYPPRRSSRSAQRGGLFQISDARNSRGVDVEKAGIRGANWQGSGRKAPIPHFRPTAIEPRGSTPSRLWLVDAKRCRWKR